MLTEGIILGGLAGAFILFLLIALLRRSALPAVTASMMGMTGLIEALAFGRLDFLPEGVGLVVFALFLASIILFLTASIRAAKDNAVLGAVLLLALVGAIVLAGLDFFDVYPGDRILRMGAAGLALLAVALSLQGGIAGDRRAAMIAPGIVIAVASLAAFFIANRSGIDHWIGIAIPHGMLAGGILLAGLMALFPAGAAEKEEDEVAAPPVMTARPVMSMSAEDDEEPALPDAITDMADEDDDEADAAPLRRTPDYEDDRADAGRPSAAPQSPISALWGHRHENLPAQAAAPAPKTEVSALRNALGAVGYALWDWTSPGQINASEETASLFGVGKISRLTPETIRGLISEADLENYDDEILGGGDPVTGRFEFTAALKSGRRLIFKGERQVDADGLVERVITFVTPAREAVAPAPVASAIDADKIRAGLAAGEFEAWFQPVVRLDDGEIAGFEALVRWRRGNGKVLQPDDFMDAAINAGLEIDIAGVMVASAAAELAAWIESSGAQGQFVSFNVSAQSLIHDRLVKLVRAEIKKHDLPDGALVVELTESHVLHDVARALSIGKALRQAGARIALDDLGAGQSTLNQLSKFRFDIIKTDRSLLEAAERDEHGHTLLAGLVDMAHRMGTQVIAEGAETAESGVMLRDMRCDFAQGYYYGRPEPAGGGASEEPEDDLHRAVTADLR